MLIAARNAMMAGKRLPYDAEVEYLESTGTQWMNTGVYIERTDRVDCICKLVDYNNTVSLFGGRETPTQNSIQILAYVKNVDSSRFDFCADGYSAVNGPLINVGQEYKFSKLGILNWIDDTPLAYNTSSGTYIAKYPAYLFCTNTAGIAGLFGNVRIKKFSIEGKQDAIPVRKNGVGEMYDRITGTFLERHGTFVIGPDIAGGGYKRKCVRRLHRRSLRPSARFCARFTPHLWKEVA